MNKVYFFASFLGLFIIPYLKQNPFDLSNIQVLHEGSYTYYIIPESELSSFDANQPTIRIDELGKLPNKLSGLQWGSNTEKIQVRVSELRDESTMFNQILTHLEESQYPYAITNTCLETAYGSYSSKNGELQFEVDKMHDFFFDATIIEEFVHAYQALYYNYTHGKFRTEQYKQGLAQGKDYGLERKKGFSSWEKFGRKHAFIESEAKLMTYFIQHQTCSISIQDIVDTDDYNTNGKGRKIINQYLGRRKKECRSSAQKLGYLDTYFVDVATFALYQQRFIQHWRRKMPHSNYTLGYFYHKPDALNNVYQPILN